GGRQPDAVVQQFALIRGEGRRRGAGHGQSGGTQQTQAKEVAAREMRSHDASPKGGPTEGIRRATPLTALRNVGWFDTTVDAFLPPPQAALETNRGGVKRGERNKRIEATDVLPGCGRRRL